MVPVKDAPQKLPSYDFETLVQSKLAVFPDPASEKSVPLPSENMVLFIVAMGKPNKPVGPNNVRKEPDEVMSVAFGEAAGKAKPVQQAVEAQGVELKVSALLPTLAPVKPRSPTIVGAA